MDGCRFHVDGADHFLQLYFVAKVVKQKKGKKGKCLLLCVNKCRYETNKSKIFYCTTCSGCFSKIAIDVFDSFAVHDGENSTIDESDSLEVST
jgi:hypothetical protein